jgi:hypothetical protein
VFASCGARPDPIPTNRAWIEVEPGTLKLSRQAYSFDPEPFREVKVTNGGDVALAVPTTSTRYLGSQSGWLDVSLSAVNDGYLLKVQPVGLQAFQPGFYKATISVDAPGAANTPVAIAVELTVSWPAVTWVERGQPPGTMLSQSAILLLESNTVLVVGSEFSDHEIYRLNPSTDTWTDVGWLLQTGRITPTLTRSPDPSGPVLISGGLVETALPGGGTAYSYATDSWELFDPATNAITARGTMRAARAGHSAVLLPDRRLLLVGGARGGGVHQTAEIFDLQTLTSVDAEMPDVFGEGPVVAAQIEGGALVTGNGTCLVFDAVHGTWAETAPMHDGRHQNALITLPSGEVLAAGGFGLGEELLASSEVYTPSLGTWRTVGDLHEPHAWPWWAGGQPVLLADSSYHLKVFAAGGGMNADGSMAASPLTQVFDPSTGSWSVAGSLATGRNYHTLTVINSNQAVVIGGEAADNEIGLRDEYFTLH